MQMFSFYGRIFTTVMIITCSHVQEIIYFDGYYWIEKNVLSGLDVLCCSASILHLLAVALDR